MPRIDSTAPFSLLLLHHIHRHRTSSSLAADFAAATKRVRAGSLSPVDAHRLFDELLRQATPVPEHYLNHFLAALARAPASASCRDGPALAIALFKRVCRGEAAGPQVVPFTDRTYRILVECCCRARRPDLALAFFGRFLRTGLSSEEVVANTLRRCLSASPPSEFWSPIAAFYKATERVRAGTLSPEDAHHMFDKLLRQPNPVPQRFLNAFLAALAQAPASGACRDGPELAFALFRRVSREEEGPQVAPLSVHTYNILMDCCCRARCPELGLAEFLAKETTLKSEMAKKTTSEWKRQIYRGGRLTSRHVAHVATVGGGRGHGHRRHVSLLCTSCAMVGHAASAGGGTPRKPTTPLPCDGNRANDSNLPPAPEAAPCGEETTRASRGADYEDA